MKFYWVLIYFCVTAPTESTYTFLKNIPGSYQRLITTQMERMQPHHLKTFPRPANFRRFFPKFLYWKHFLELECFKEICNRAHLKDYSEYQSPLNKTSQMQLSNSRNINNNHNFQTTRKYQLKPEPQNINNYPGKERIMFWFPETPVNKKQINIFPAEQELVTKTKSTTQSNLVNYQRPVDTQSYPRENKNVLENTEIAPEENNSGEMVPDDEIFLKFFKKPNSVQPSYSDSARENFRPYEVEEIIEEKYEVDLDDDKDEDHYKTFVGSKDYGIGNQDEKVSSAELNKKNEHYQSIINDSVSMILSKLIGSTNTSDVPLHPERPEKWSLSGKADPLLGTSFVRQDFANYPVAEKTTENTFRVPWNFQENYSSLNKTPQTTLQPNKIYNWRQKATERTQMLNTPKKLFKPDTNNRINNSRRFEFSFPSKSDSFLLNVLKSGFPRPNAETEAIKPSSLDILTKDSFHVTEDSVISPINTPETLNYLKNNTAHYQADFPTKEKDNSKNKETRNMFTKDPPSKATYSSVTPKTTDFFSETVKEFLPQEATTVDLVENLEERFQEEDIPSTTENFMEVDTSDEETTKSDFKEFTDQPVLFDLLPTTINSDGKKDLEDSKNSRKMKFSYMPEEPTLSNNVLDPTGTEQRRSDILITDNLSDYVDEENNLPSTSYLEKLKLNNTSISLNPFNFSSDSLVPLVSAVINDLRENKIPFDDISILSQALGKYWKPILALSNMTNLDMLPFLKMKNENDLENFLKSFFPADATISTTTEESQKTDEDYSEMYDYMEQYKDLYKDMLGQDVGDKKRFRPRRDAEDYFKTLEARREYFESLEEEQNDDENHYLFEDIMYDEMLNGDYSVFELKKVTSVEVDSET